MFEKNTFETKKHPTENSRISNKTIRFWNNDDDDDDHNNNNNTNTNTNNNNNNNNNNKNNNNNNFNSYFNFHSPRLSA